MNGLYYILIRICGSVEKINCVKNFLSIKIAFFLTSFVCSIVMNKYTHIHNSYNVRQTEKDIIFLIKIKMRKNNAKYKNKSKN